MEIEGKGREREGKKLEFTGIKLKRGISSGRRVGNSTPSPTWKIGFAQTDGSLVQDLNFPITTTHTARKLGANLWEVQPHLKMSKGGARRRHHHNHHKDKGFELPNQSAEPPDRTPEQPASNLRRHIAASLTQHHRSVERNGHALQPLSPASYSSSMEVAPYNPTIPPSCSKGRIGETSYSLKTSSELLKVLNRIWNLEEQHASNISLVKALKRELDHSRARIKELLQEKKRDWQETDDLMKRIAEDRIKDAVQSVRDELEDERKLRKHSENLHRKLARELSEVKSSFSNGLKELERERKARILLENLCDEFAKGIRDYELEVRFLKHRPEKDCVMREHRDRLILHISEAWLDERMQMKLAEARCDLAEKNTIVDKLSFEIETFLQAKQSVGSGNNINDDLSSKRPKESSLHRHSLESFHLNEAASAPGHGDYEENSKGSASHCFELNRGSSGKQRNSCSKQVESIPESHPEEIATLNTTKKKIRSREVFKGHELSSLQMQFEENPVEVKNSQKLEITELTQEGSQEIKNKRVGVNEMNSNHENKHMEDSFDRSAFTGHACTVQQSISTLSAPDPEVLESCSKLPQGIKENTLKAKLLEARLEGQQSRSKTFKGYF